MIAFGVALLVIGIVLYISHLLGNAKKGLRIYNYLKEKVKVSHTININRTRE